MYACVYYQSSREKVVRAGSLFIWVSQRWLEQFEDVKFQSLRGANARKVVLVVGIMAAHALGEGSGVGVSFCIKGHITLARLLVDLGNIVAAAAAGPALLHVCGRLSSAAPAGAGVCCRLHGMDGVCGAPARCAG